MIRIFFRKFLLGFDKILLDLTFETGIQNMKFNFYKPTVFVIFALFFSYCSVSALELSTTERKRLNVFFSNFSEANVPDFTQETLTDEMLINFAKQHYFLNRYNRMKETPDKMFKLAPKQWVDQAAMKYFGKKLNKHSDEAGYYKIPIGDSGGFIFSQIDKLELIKGNLYEAQVKTYSSYSGQIIDIHGNAKIWKKAGEDVFCHGLWKAVIEKKANTHKSRFVLISYKKIKESKRGEVMEKNQEKNESVSIDQQDRLGRSALHRAALNGDLAQVKALIAQGANVNNKSTVGTPLYYAVDEGHVGIVKELVENGANVNEPNGIGYLPLDTAKENLGIAFSPEDRMKFAEVVQYLLSKGAKQNKK